MDSDSVGDAIEIQILVVIFLASLDFKLGIFIVVFIPNFLTQSWRFLFNNDGR